MDLTNGWVDGVMRQSDCWHEFHWDKTIGKSHGLNKHHDVPENMLHHITKWMPQITPTSSSEHNR